MSLSLSFPPSIGVDVNIGEIMDLLRRKADDKVTGKITSVEDVILNNTGTIDKAYVTGITKDGTTGVATLNNTAVINNAFINQSGIINNMGDNKTQIGSAIVSGGELNNSGYATITNASILSGKLQDYGGSVLDSTLPRLRISPSMAVWSRTEATEAKPRSKMYISLAAPLTVTTTPR